MEVSTLAELIPWSGMGFGGVVTLGLYMILTGKLVPKATVDEMRRERDARLADMLAANRALQESGKVRDAQVTELLENSRATAQMIRSIKAAAQTKEGDPP